MEEMSRHNTCWSRDLEEEAMAANSTAPPPPLLATMDETRQHSICRCGWVGTGGVGEELKDFSLI
jgi:hypothetical protein